MIKVQESLLKILSDVLWRKTSEYTYSEQEWEDILSTAEDQGSIAPCITGMHIDSAAGFCCELAEMAKQDALDNDK